MQLMPRNIKLPSRASISHAYEHLSEKFGLLNFLVDVQCRITSQGWEKQGIEGFPSQFLVSVLERLTANANKDLDVVDPLELCDYHEHKNEDEREACPHKDVYMP